jgi:ABC-type nitrate/sulfonate/bicarbonate transport system permease component
MSNVPSQSEQPPGPAIPADTVVRKPKNAARVNSGGFFALRRPIPQWLGILLGLLCILLVYAIWWYLTHGEPEERILGTNSLRSPAETLNLDQLHTFWFDNALTRNLGVSLRRVVIGFALAAGVGIPLGVLCGCFPWVNAFLAPINVFGRNIPIAALIPLTFALFGIGELQKVMFIFIAAVAFIMMDTSSAVADVDSRYIDTAYTLGASRKQVIMKVLVPLAMPRVFNSLRLLFGLAFGYIMLAEVISESERAGGLGRIIIMAQRRGQGETILLVLMVIPAVALAIDRILYLVQKSLFPYQYASDGILHNAWRGLMHAAEGLRHKVIAPRPLDPAQQADLAAARTRHPTAAAKNSS